MCWNVKEFLFAAGFLAVGEVLMMKPANVVKCVVSASKKLQAGVQ